MSNLYDILGITDTSCSSAVIKKAWFKMSKKWHPDKNGGSKESTNMTAKINQAKEVLLDDDLRRAYDHGGLELVEQVREMKKRQDEQARMQQPTFVRFGISVSDIFNNVTKKIQFTRTIISDDGTKKIEEDSVEIEAGNITDFNARANLKGKGDISPGKINGDVIVQFMKESTNNADDDDNDCDDFDIEQGSLVLKKKIGLQMLLSGKRVPIKHPNGKTYLVDKKLNEVMRFQNLGIKGEEMIIILELDLSSVLSDKELRGRLLSQFDKKLPNVEGKVLFPSEKRRGMNSSMEIPEAVQCPVQ